MTRDVISHHFCLKFQEIFSAKSVVFERDCSGVRGCLKILYLKPNRL